MPDAPLLVRDLMSAPVIALLAEQPLPLAAEIMEWKHLRHLPVVDGARRIVGIVSHRDLLRAQVSSLTALADLDRRWRQSNIHVDQIMTRQVVTVRADTPAAIAGTLLIEQRIGCLPVQDDAGALIGIVTAHDYLRYAVRALSGP